ncbi:hypothetical protein F0562_012611 [Nyssa sinensis]|uniref:Ubiquitin-like domain-containing protein n=1 Tax=Nyssa sinensis TaxID=561372 RepID=A0A5J4ZTJ2_9ASTE|nr:hypothetical protein F0562_012611 [Nyssa sinensis]
MGEIDNHHSNREETTVQIALKTIGPSPPSRLNVPPRIKVQELRKLIARNDRLPIENLRLILRGKVLHDNENGVDEFIQLSDGDSLLVAVKPKPPVKHIRDGLTDNNDDDDDLKFQLPQSTSGWKRRLFAFLRDKLRLPDMLLMAIFSLSLKVWTVIIIWFILAPIAHRWDLGPLYILGTGFAIIFLNLGQRQHGDMSAYSIFNEDFRELPGTLNADRLDRDIRAGVYKRQEVVEKASDEWDKDYCSSVVAIALLIHDGTKQLET